MDINSRLDRIATDLAELRGEVHEAAKHTASKTDIAELKLLLEQRMHTQLTAKQRAAIITAITTAATSAVTALYALLSQ